MAVFNKIKKIWNAFTNRDIIGGYKILHDDYTYTSRPDRLRIFASNEKSIVNAIYNRIAVDCSTLKVSHVKLTEDGKFKEIIDSKLNDVLTLSANIDQTSQAFFEDAVYSLLDEGCIAIVPIETDNEPFDHDSYSIYNLRVGQIVEWHKESVKINVYNELTGQKEYLNMPKTAVAIIENPFFSIMNAPNSTLQRLKKKLALLDVVDEKSASKKLDLIIQLPYLVRSESQQKQAKRRVKDIETQLGDSQWGIAYTDGTERITQLNRPVENNLLSQVEYLTEMLYSQLGITKEIMNGTASPEVMNNYFKRTIGPIMSAVVVEIKRKFLSRTAISQKQSIMFFMDPFELTSLSTLSTLADSLIRNEIMTSNEFRGILALPPSSSAGADELANPNINPTNGEEMPMPDDIEADEFNSMLDELENDIDSILMGEDSV